MICITSQICTLMIISVSDTVVPASLLVHVTLVYIHQHCNDRAMFSCSDVDLSTTHDLWLIILAYHYLLHYHCQNSMIHFQNE